MVNCNYPGCESENLGYYDQFDSTVKEKWKENYEKLPSILQFVEGGTMKIKFYKHKYKYNLVALKDIEPNSELLKLLAENGFDINNVYKVSQLTFYNKKLYQGKYLFLVYKIQNGKLKIYGAIDSNENVEKFARPLEFSLDFKINLGKQIAKLLGCKNCDIKVDGNQILIYKKEIKEHHKTYKKGIFRFDLEWGRKVKYEPIGQIVLGNYGGLIKNTKGQVVGRLENYGNEWLVLNTRGQKVANFKNESVINLDLSELKMDIKLKLKDF